MSTILKFKRAKTYERTLNLHVRNPVNQERIREKCPICEGKRVFKSINSLYGHFKEEHIPYPKVNETNEEFQIRTVDSFDCKSYLLSLVDKKLKGEI